MSFRADYLQQLPRLTTATVDAAALRDHLVGHAAVAGQHAQCREAAGLDQDAGTHRAGFGRLLEHRDVVAVPREQGRARQAGKAGADHRDLQGRAFMRRRCA